MGMETHFSQDHWRLTTLTLIVSANLGLQWAALGFLERRQQAHPHHLAGLGVM